MPPSRESWLCPKERSKSTWPASSRSSTCPSPNPTIAASWPSYGSWSPDRSVHGSPGKEGRNTMTFVTSHMSVSLDGFVAGPEQSQENPLGIDGMKLHRWHLDDPKHPVDDAFTRRLLGPRG